MIEDESRNESTTPYATTRIGICVCLPSLFLSSPRSTIKRKKLLQKKKKEKKREKNSNRPPLSAFTPPPRSIQDVIVVKINGDAANILGELEVSRAHQPHGGAYRRVR